MMMILNLLIVGAVLALLFVALTFRLSRAGEIFARVLLFIGLIVAAGAYLAFAVRAGAGPGWVLTELVQLVAFTAVAALGLRGSTNYLAAGWALHPLWDIVVHYVGPGNSFAPLSYAIACGSFDLVVAAYIWVHYGVIRRSATVAPVP